MSGDTKFTITNGTLTAYAGFTMSSGTLQTLGWSATINIGCDNTFQLSGGVIDVTDVAQRRAVGTVTINGSFTGTGGTIHIDVDTGGGIFGTLTVNGDVNLSTGCYFYMDDVALFANHVAGTNSRGLFTWSGTRTGTLTFSLPSDWTGSSGDNNLVLTET